MGGWLSLRMIKDVVIILTICVVGIHRDSDIARAIAIRDDWLSQVAELPASACRSTSS